ncbi:hypothetical protein DM02DRAFT_615326 [Periconia macrospinosa]|uniref:Uncharacterized protein n=1 Tax=Periconia macrospinosa TaxID=97972 RepID=A0A2V1DLY7_9PLEO|nr:hypothetical protein DM02DRAFT_615326 [Periconia macrospinosa]
MSCITVLYSVINTLSVSPSRQGEKTEALPVQKKRKGWRGGWESGLLNRPNQTKPDQTRLDQTRPDERRSKDTLKKQKM